MLREIVEAKAKETYASGEVIEMMKGGFKKAQRWILWSKKSIRDIGVDLKNLKSTDEGFVIEGEVSERRIKEGRTEYGASFGRFIDHFRDMCGFEYNFSYDTVKDFNFKTKKSYTDEAIADGKRLRKEIKYNTAELICTAKQKGETISFKIELKLTKES